MMSVIFAHQHAPHTRANRTKSVSKIPSINVLTPEKFVTHTKISNHFTPIAVVSNSYFQQNRGLYPIEVTRRMLPYVYQNVISIFIANKSFLKASDSEVREDILDPCSNHRVIT